MILFAFLYLVTLPASSLKWHSFNDGMAKAKKENKQVLLDVYTEWCGWCKVMDQKTYSDPNVIKYLNEKYVLIRLNPETDPPVTFRGKQYDAAQFASGIGVNGYPATVFLEPSEALITMVPGFIEAPSFLNILRYIGDKKYNEMSFDDYMKKSGGL